MSLLTAQKKQIISDYQTTKNDTGSVEVQVALLTEAINALTEHCKNNSHDYHSRDGLIGKVNERRKLLKYLKSIDIERYRALVKRLDLRDIN